MSVVASPECHLQSSPQGMLVLMGPHAIPIKKIDSFHVPFESRTVRLICTEAMGLPGAVELDFLLETSLKMQQFIYELLDKTEAYFLYVYKLKTIFEDETGRGSVEFTFSGNRQAKEFLTYATPFYFPEYEATLDLKKDDQVAVTSKPGNKEEIIKSMNHALKRLNLHSLNSVNSALLENKNPDFPGVQKDPEDLVPKVAKDYFSITFRDVKKYLESLGENRALGFTEEAAQEAFHKMQDTKEKAALYANLGGKLKLQKNIKPFFKPLSEHFQCRATSILTAVSEILKRDVPKNPVELEVFNNLSLTPCDKLNNLESAITLFSNLARNIEQFELNNPLPAPKEEEKRPH